MLRNVRVLVQPSVWTSSRCSYVTHKEFKNRISLAKQDEEKVHQYNYPPSGRINRRVYAWGLTVTGALGIHQNLKKLNSRLVHVQKHPLRQSFAERNHVIDVASGYGFTLFACKPDENGTTLYGTGLNSDSQIGFHKLGGDMHKPMLQLIYPAPLQLPKSEEDGDTLVLVKQVAAGRAHSAVLANNGCVYTLGNNSFGQCGRPIIDEENYSKSHVIHRLGADVFGTEDAISKVICGQDHTLFLTKGGRVFACGWSADGQTGQGHYKSVDRPTLVAGDIATEEIVKVVSSVDCVLAMNSEYHTVNVVYPMHNDRH